MSNPIKPAALLSLLGPLLDSETLDVQTTPVAESNLIVGTEGVKFGFGQIKVTFTPRFDVIADLTGRTVDQIIDECGPTGTQTFWISDHEICYASDHSEYISRPVSYEGMLMAIGEMLASLQCLTESHYFDGKTITETAIERGEEV